MKQRDPSVTTKRAQTRVNKGLLYKGGIYKIDLSVVKVGAFGVIRREQKICKNKEAFD